MAAIELFSTSLFSDANLVSYWRFEGNSTDSKGSNNGSDTAITYNSGNGQFGQGAGLNGTTSLISLGNNVVNLKLTSSFSISCWAKLPSGTGSYAAFTSYAQNTNVAGILFGVNMSGGGAHKFELISGKNTGTTIDTDFKVVASTTTVDDDVRRHIVGTWDGTKLHIYVNGTEEGTGSAWANAPAYQATSYQRIGSQVNTGTDATFWPGSIDDLAIFNRALSPTEVSQLYNGTLPTTTLSGNFAFL